MGAFSIAGPPRRVPDPYRVMFPIGLLLTLAGALVWPLYAWRGAPYPGIGHRTLMIEGYQISFVLGFLLTAMVGFLRNPRRCGGTELTVVAILNFGVGVCALAGWTTLAHLLFTLSVVALAVVLGRRFAGRSGDPPEEFLFIAFGLTLGIAAGIVLTGQWRGLWFEPSPGFGARLVALGMVLPIVLGLGSLLVPTFAGIPRGLDIQGIAGAHERPGRRRLYSSVIALLAAAVAADGLGWTQIAAWLRALAATPMLVPVWKVFSAGGHKTLAAWTLRMAGMLILAGLWIAAFLPQRPLAGFHLVFLGGFGLLTLGIASRVVVVHGGHPIADEGKLLTPVVVALIVLAALSRLGAEFGARGRDVMLAMSGVMWAAGWILWSVAALPRILRRAPAR